MSYHRMIALILPLPPIDFPPPLLPFLLPPPLFFSQVSEDMLRLVVEEAQRSVTGIDTGEGRMIKAVLDMQDTEVSEWCLLSLSFSYFLSSSLPYTHTLSLHLSLYHTSSCTHIISWFFVPSPVLSSPI